MRRLSPPDWTKISRFLAFKISAACCGQDDADFFVAANTDRQDIMVKIPPADEGMKWYRIADTSIEDDTVLLGMDEAEELISQSRYVLPANSMLILASKADTQAQTDEKVDEDQSRA